MKCPICGCKMKEEFMCPYCKITGQQVKDASNKKAKERIKNKDTKEVYNSTYMPKDVNHTRLLLITLILGMFGMHHLYVGRNKMGFFYLFSTFYAVIFYSLSKIIFVNNVTLSYFCSFGYVICAIILFKWIADFFKVCFKKFSIPVVLGDVKFKKEDKKK